MKGCQLVCHYGLRRWVACWLVQKHHPSVWLKRSGSEYLDMTFSLFWHTCRSSMGIPSKISSATWPGRQQFHSDQHAVKMDLAHCIKDVTSNSWQLKLKTACAEQHQSRLAIAVEEDCLSQPHLSPNSISCFRGDSSTKRSKHHNWG